MNDFIDEFAFEFFWFQKKFCICVKNLMWKKFLNRLKKIKNVKIKYFIKWRKIKIFVIRFAFFFSFHNSLDFCRNEKIFCWNNVYSKNNFHRLFLLFVTLTIWIFFDVDHFRRFSFFEFFCLCEILRRLTDHDMIWLFLIVLILFFFDMCVIQIVSYVFIYYWNWIVLWICFFRLIEQIFQKFRFNDFFFEWLIVFWIEDFVRYLLNVFWKVFKLNSFFLKNRLFVLIFAIDFESFAFIKYTKTLLFFQCTLLSYFCQILIFWLFTWYAFLSLIMIDFLINWTFIDSLKYELFSCIALSLNKIIHVLFL